MIRNVMFLVLLPMKWTGGFVFASAAENVGKKFGDHCTATEECAFDYAICDTAKNRCHCHPDYPISNHIDKCGRPVGINETCTFHEECEATIDETECRNNVCTCLFEKLSIVHTDGRIECVSVKTEDEGPPRYRDPAMIGILVAMILMFITICVVLRLFSKARWRENRTIFNTPNPRLMNASLLKEHKQDRRGSKASVRGPSRQSSLLSIKSPDSGARGGFRADIHGSKTSLHSNSDQNRSKLASNDEKTVIDI